VEISGWVRSEKVRMGPYNTRDQRDEISEAEASFAARDRYAAELDLAAALPVALHRA
jgi:hypothetical protein